MKFVVLLGAPGSGKGTQAQILEKKHNFYKVSTGDILRSEIASESDLGHKIKIIVESGNLIDDELMVSIIKNKISENLEKFSGFVLDGFPRNVNQASILDKMLSSIGCDVNKVIYLEVGSDKLIDRITKRYVCSNCGENYNSKYKNTKIDGVCDICGSKEFNHRADDSEETVRNRLNVYMEQTSPLLPYYEKEHKLVRIDADKEIEQVTKAIDIAL
jgi:adenylate kinase